MNAPNQDIVTVVHACGHMWESANPSEGRWDPQLLDAAAGHLSRTAQRHPSLSCQAAAIKQIHPALNWVPQPLTHEPASTILGPTTETEPDRLDMVEDLVKLLRSDGYQALLPAGARATTDGQREWAWYALLNAFLHLTDTVVWSQLYYEGWSVRFAKLAVYLSRRGDPRYESIQLASRRSKQDHLPWREWLDAPAKVLWPNGRPTRFG